MEALEQLLGIYQKDARTQQIVQQLAKDSTRIQLTGLVGAQNCFVLDAVRKQHKTHHLFIAQDKEDAAYIENTLAALIGQRKVHFFPDSFKRPLQFEKTDQNNTLYRSETINKIISSSTGDEIVVTYPEALFEKVVAPKLLQDNRIQVTVGEQLDSETMVMILGEYGFVKEDFVYEPGQFSIRGSIIDIFSYANDYPYRIELFDDEVESIRAFDPISQLSVHKLKHLAILPNLNTKFKQEEKVSLLEVFDKQVVIWAQKPEQIIEKLGTCMAKAQEFAESLDKKATTEEENEEFFHDRAFILPEEIITNMERFSTIWLDNKTLSLSTDLTIEYPAKPQTHFNKNFVLLIEELNANTSKGIHNYIFAENPKQIERFYAIFKDMEANVKFTPITQSIHSGFVDQTNNIACYTDHQIFKRFHRYKLRKGFTKDKALSLRLLKDLQPGDFVTHIDHGVGRFSGLEKILVNGQQQESVRLMYKNNDLLYVGINSLHKIAKYKGKDGSSPTLNKLGSEAWTKLKQRTSKKIKDIAAELIKLYAKRKASQGHAFQADGYLQNELEASFIYEDTPDQFQATQDVKEDMMKAYPMDRLICGDVGFGKTEVAIRAAFKATVGGKQVAILVPTTILALQHYRTFHERLSNFGVTVGYVNRFRTAKQKKETFELVKEGKIDILIGTHAILGKSVGFKDLGLLIIDEEQKFGVSAKEKLRNLKVNVDTLTLTATPIPRTLQFSLMAARDLSVIRTPPPNRQPIHTEVRVMSEELIKSAIYYEIDRGGQVFFVHNRVKSLPEMTTIIKKLCPDIDIGMAHGQMSANDLEKALVDFIDKKYDVLVCTNIIETGLDIPNANTMIINNAHHFGMSDLHQLRGRVGRSNKKAFCYLFSQPMSVLTSDARKRLKAIEEHSSLGSGFEIAMRDLDIRGAGNMLGGEQSGFITEIGYETYQRILEEAILELKENEFKDLFQEEMEQKMTFVHDVKIDTDIEMLIPDAYVNNTTERLSLYTQLNTLNTEEEIANFDKMMADRFGRVPMEVKSLYDGLRLRNLAKSLGFERIILKNKKLRCVFIENPQSPFYETALFTAIMGFIASQGGELGLSMKQKGQHLMVIKENITHIKDVVKLLESLQEKLNISSNTNLTTK